MALAKKELPDEDQPLDMERVSIRDLHLDFTYVMVAKKSVRGMNMYGEASVGALIFAPGIQPENLIRK